MCVCMHEWCAKSYSIPFNISDFRHHPEGIQGTALQKINGLIGEQREREEIGHTLYHGYQQSRQQVNQP